MMFSVSIRQPIKGRTTFEIISFARPAEAIADVDGHI